MGSQVCDFLFGSMRQVLAKCWSTFFDIPIELAYGDLLEKLVGVSAWPNKTGVNKRNLTKRREEEKKKSKYGRPTETEDLTNMCCRTRGSNLKRRSRQTCKIAAGYRPPIRSNKPFSHQTTNRRHIEKGNKNMVETFQTLQKDQGHQMLVMPIHAPAPQSRQRNLPESHQELGQ